MATLFVARILYVVDSSGLTVLLPRASTVPRPLSMVTSVALVVSHVRVVELPLVMEVGFALIVTVGSAVDGRGVIPSPAGMVGAAGACLFLPHPADRSMSVMATTTVDVNSNDDFFMEQISFLNLFELSITFQHTANFRA
jgi:hypothetical protein